MSKWSSAKRVNSTIKDCMYRDVKITPVEATLKEGGQLFIDWGPSALLVTEVGNYVGIVSGK